MQGTGLYGNDNYTYDAVGNRLTRTLVTTGTASTTYGYVANSNRLSSAASGGSTRNYSYDAAGNLITVKLGTKTQAAYTFSNSGRMATSSSASYNYDASGARVLEAVTGGATTHFIFAPKRELLAEDNAAGQVQRSYVYLNGAPLALVDSIGSVSYILSDQVGQPQKMLSASGALNWDRVAGIFGDTVAQPVGARHDRDRQLSGTRHDRHRHAAARPRLGRRGGARCRGQAAGRRHRHLSLGRTVAACHAEPDVRNRRLCGQWASDERCRGLTRTGHAPLTLWKRRSSADCGRLGGGKALINPGGPSG